MPPAVALECCLASCCSVFVFFFFNDTATTEIYTLSLHDALPIWCCCPCLRRRRCPPRRPPRLGRSEEHTSELQSPCNLVCRLLLEKKNSIFRENDLLWGMNGRGRGGTHRLLS